MVTHPETSLKISNRLKREWSEGKRSQHSRKLTESWKHRDRQAQGLLFSELKTKYVYSVDGRDVDYKTLKMLGLSNVQATFHKCKRNRAFFKGSIIERRLL